MACFADFAFGPYTATYKGFDLGHVDRAWFLESQAEVKDIRVSMYGESVVGGIYLGINAFCVTRLKEWNSDVIQAIHPWDETAGAMGRLGRTGDHGRCVEELAGQLQLTAVDGTPAALLGPTTITADLAIYAPRHNLQIALGNMERDLHMVFQLYPQKVAGSNSGLIHYTAV